MTEIATLANGCFWCTEAVFQRLRGVSKVESGYTGGEGANPSYEAVCTGRTGHAEAIRLTFDPDVLSYEQLLDVFFATHDPTTLNRQGDDIGSQYRSAIYVHDDAQRQTAGAVIERLQPEFGNRIVTEVTDSPEFYPAEDYHQNYYNDHRSAGYCRIVIDPKVQKLLANYADMTV